MSERKPDQPPLGSFPIVGVGASAGGLEAFTQLLKHLPADTGMAFVLIQHLDPAHTSFLSDVLAKATAMVVAEATQSTLVQPNRVYVIPPNADIAIHDGRIELSGRDHEGRRLHLPIDHFLAALAADRGAQAIGVILSGTGADGTDGLKAIKAADGITFAQEPLSAKFPGMPRSAIDAGAVDYCLTIPELAAELVRISGHPYVTVGQAPPPRCAASTFAKILEKLRDGAGLDFSEYKLPTLERRLERRMAVRRADDAERYLELLHSDPAEVRALADDILIHVTWFFRDGPAFDALKAQVFPAILEQKAPGEAVRMWVAGCSTGEEVYSLAIVALEAMGDGTRPLQIFGSDVSPSAIEKARAGVYTENALREVSDERRRRYFVKDERGYRVSAALRELCVFVPHDLCADPPFSRLDLVSCRNVLIYFDGGLQKRVLARFHYALNQPGYLLLGRAENVSGFGQLFSTLDQQSKIFMRSPVPSTIRFARNAAAEPAAREPATASVAHAPRPIDLAKVVDRLLLSRYAPAGVLINDRMEILQFRGLTGAFLQAAPGEPQNNILKMARGGLLATLRATIASARKANNPVRSEPVDVGLNGDAASCCVVVIPYQPRPDGKEMLYLVLFEELPAAAGTRAAVRRGKTQPRVAQLEHELAATKDYLHSLIDEQGRTNDNLGSANQELVSGNEELQSMNEELETAKEELQSTNEELTTVNDELHLRNQETLQINSDLVNVLGTVDIPIIILDLERRIRRFTPNARAILNVLPGDVGRPFSDIRANLAVGDLDEQIAAVIATTTARESEVQDAAGHWHRMLIRPYRTLDNRVDGAVVSLIDIDALKHHIREAQEFRAEAERANRSKDDFLATLSHELRSPLSSMLLHAQLMRGGGMDEKQVQRAGEAIERGTRMQLQLIEDLLDVSRIVAGKMTLAYDRVQLGKVVEAALDGNRAAAARKSVEIVVTPAPAVSVLGDATRLQQVVSNLVGNAIKFTPKGGRVTVTLDSFEGQARLAVTDTGVGIEPAFMAKIFNRFTQEDSSSLRTFSGLGLGLAIVRHLVELHGGTVSATSPGKGGGATFIVTLALAGGMSVLQHAAADAATLAEERGPPPVDVRELASLRLLVIDDDLGNSEVLSDLLVQRGATVVVVGSASEAITAIEKVRPDLLLCDVAMPDETGYTFIRRLRALSPAQGGDIPAVALTGMARDQDHREALAAGFQLHLTKPVDVAQLLASIATLVANRPASA